MRYLVFCFALLLFNSCFIGSSNGSDCTDDIDCASNYCDPDDFTCKTDPYNNPCDGINCGAHGICRVDSWNDAYCDCDAGYVESTSYYTCEPLQQSNCTEGNTRRLYNSCGINGRGTLYQICQNDTWVDSGSCADPDRCRDNDLQWDSCSYGAGYRNRLCQYGQWGNWTTCSAECTEGDSRLLQNVCGVNGYGDQYQLCSGGVWVDNGSCIDGDECVDGDVQYNYCNNGSDYQERSCVDGLWSTWSACYSSSECYNGDTRIFEMSCGLNGMGSQYQTCSGGVWIDDGCQDYDECVNGSTDTYDCGDGTYQDVSCQDGTWYTTSECY